MKQATLTSIEEFNKKLATAEKFELLVTGFFNPQEPIEITFDKERAVRHQNRHWEYADVDIEPAFDISKEEFISKLTSLNIALWKREYVDYGVLDGTQWELVIHYDNGEKKKYEGSNDFPNEFGDLCKLFGIDFNTDDEDEEHEED